MNTPHLPDTQIQIYADTPEAISISHKAHLDICGHCRDRLANYQLIGNAVREMTVPAFEFDLNELVPQPATVPVKRPLPWIAIAAALAGTVMVLFAAIIFAANIMSLFRGLSNAQRYLLSLPLIVLALIQLIIQLIAYQRKLARILNKNKFIAT